MTMHPCRQECERLLALADAMPITTEEAKVKLKDWQTRVLTVMSKPELETLEGEQTLEKLANQLRQLWMLTAHQFSDPHFKSPPLSSIKFLASGQKIEYSYERNIKPDFLEKRATSYRPVPDGWQADHVLFSSGMAGMATFLQSYLSMVRPTSQDPLKLLMWGGYFETHVLIELLRQEAFICSRAKTQESVWTSVVQGDVDLLLIEPVIYDWDLEILDLRQLVTSWHRRVTDRPSVIVIDTTLVGETVPIGQLLTALATSPPTLVVQINSGLKLDQQGLEFSNVGIVSIYTCNQNTDNPTASQIAKYLRACRTIVGSGLSMDEIALLDVPFFLERKSLLEYASTVFLNNAVLAKSINFEGGLFSRIAHPSLSELANLPWAHAPFVVFHLAEDTLDNHGLLLAVVNYEARRRGLSFIQGSSFGFRGHRFEVILPKLIDKRGLFKIALGARSGPSRNDIIQLLNELASYPDFSALHAAYPDLNPVDLYNVES